MSISVEGSSPVPHWLVAQEDLGTDDGLGVAVSFSPPSHAFILRGYILCLLNYINVTGFGGACGGRLV